MALTTRKQLFSTLLLLSLSSELCALTFNTEGCGETKGCYASPASCTTSENCDFLVTYNATNSTHVEFELSGKGDWIAVGFSDDRSMINTDILMCVNNQSLSGHYYATEKSRPPRTNPTPAAVEIIEQADVDNITKCRISREVNPVPAIANFTDLNQEVFLLAAYGNVNGSILQRHLGREASPMKIRVTQANSTVTNGSQSVPAVQQGSFRFPDNCPDADCDFLVTYQASGDNSVVFELRGGGNWAGVGFSGDNQMPDTDILICSSDTSLSGHYYAEDRTRPTRTNPTPSAVNISDQSFNNGFVSCRITRELNPGIENFRNLEQQQFLLGAIGPLDGAVIGIHSDRRASSSAVSVTQANFTVSPPTEPPTMQQGSFRFPDNCPDADCDFLVTYQASGDNSVVFDLRGRGNWAGVGFSDDNQMPDTDILICASDTSLSGHYYAEDRTRPTRTNSTPSAVVISDESFNNGLVSCRITRELNPGIENFRNLEEQQFLLGAIGPLSGPVIGIHSDRRASSSRVDVRQGGVVGSSSTGKATKEDWRVHGILMTLAWTLFAFVGLFTARYMRQVWEPRKLLGEKAWFTVHRTLMTITVLLTIASAIFIFVKEERWSYDAGAHPFCGMVAITFAVIQPIMAAFRPHPGEPRRNIFNWAHRIVGTVALIMAVVTIYLGLNEYDPKNVGKPGLYAVIAFYVGEFCIFLFELYLILSKRNKEKRTSQVNNEIPMSQPGHQNPTQPEMTMKEAMIRTLMFLFVILLGASVSLTIILLLALN